MNARQFRRAIERLGLTHTQARATLAVSAVSRISEWACGTRAVPPYIAAHVGTLLELRARTQGVQHVYRNTRTGVEMALPSSEWQLVKEVQFEGHQDTEDPDESA